MKTRDVVQLLSKMIDQCRERSECTNCTQFPISKYPYHREEELWCRGSIALEKGRSIMVSLQDNALLLLLLLL